MSGALSSLGLGSQGVLTMDIIDQLKEADESAVIKPIERNIDLNNNKQEALADIKTLLTDLNTSVVAMSEPDLYKNKTSSITGDSISVDVTADAKEQTFDIDVKSLATRDIQESAIGFAYDGALVEPQTLTISIGDEEFEIETSVTDSISTIADKINKQTNGKVEASILNVGGDDPYKLIIKSAETGEDNAISVTSSETDETKSLAFNRIGDPPQDAEVEVDGILVQRSSNKIDDLVDGVTLNLESVGKSTVNVESDNTKLVEGMSDFVQKYNDIINKLADVTKYDKEQNSAGVFQGSSEMRSITSTLNDIIARTTTADGKTLTDFGIEPQRGGTLSFNESDFEDALKENSQNVEDFFRGTDGSNGLFNKFEDSLFDISTSSSGVMKSLKNSIEGSLTSLADEQTKAQKRLDDRYAIMERKFADYDNIIAGLTRESDSIQSIIDAQYIQ